MTGSWLRGDGGAAVCWDTVRVRRFSSAGLDPAAEDAWLRAASYGWTGPCDVLLRCVACTCDACGSDSSGAFVSLTGARGCTYRSADSEATSRTARQPAVRGGELLDRLDLLTLDRIPHAARCASTMPASRGGARRRQERSRQRAHQHATGCSLLYVRGNQPRCDPGDRQPTSCAVRCRKRFRAPASTTQPAATPMPNHACR